MPNKVAICAVSEMESVQKKRFVIGDFKIMLVRIEDNFYAMEDTCSHAEASLTSGFLHGFQIECPRHGARFDVRNGEVVALPAVMPLKTFPVTVENGQIVLELGDDCDEKGYCEPAGGCSTGASNNAGCCGNCQCN